MRMRSRWMVFILALPLALGLVLAYFMPHQDGFSARAQPSRWEAFLARQMRYLSTPRKARYAKNPFTPTPEVLAEARAHFADHCAVCHANDGSGNTPMGQNLYPKAPDMRQSATQSLSDGELFFIIHNGIRLSGMPAWGPPDPDQDEDSWKLVLFIRHLPAMTQEEIQSMEALNPKSIEELRERKEEEEFLRGDNPPASGSPDKKHHH